MQQMAQQPTTRADHLVTARGTIKYPAYIPVTTFGDKYPLDGLLQPYLPRLAPAVMVSFHYAQAMDRKPRVPLLIDSGGFAALFDGATIVEHRGLGVLHIAQDESDQQLTPLRVLDFQEERADVAFTLDFPIPPGTGRQEAERRMELTVANAAWAIENRRRKDMPLFASIQGLDADDYCAVAATLAKYAFDGFAIGGLVPRARDWDGVTRVVTGVLKEAGNRPVHAFGMGNPATTRQLFSMGVASVDSSSYVRLAADGKTWGDVPAPEDPGTMDRVFLALSNLAEAGRDTPTGRNQRLPMARETCAAYTACG